MLTSLYIFIIYECILLFSWKENFINFPSVKLVNCQDFYGVSSSVKSLALPFDTVGQLMDLLACDLILFLLSAMLE